MLPFSRYPQSIGRVLVVHLLFSDVNQFVKDASEILQIVAMGRRHNAPPRRRLHTDAGGGDVTRATEASWQSLTPPC